MSDFSDRLIQIKVISQDSKYSEDIKALIDTGASHSCIPKKIVAKLNLQPVSYTVVTTEFGQKQIPQYLVGFEIKGRVFKITVSAIETLDFALIGWDILASYNILPDLIENVFEQTLALLSAIPEFKNKVVLILGQDTTEIKRLYAIREALSDLGYNGIIVKEIDDIEIQSVEEKVNMLASLSKFIVCENSVTSGHIDELKICSMNRFTTAILQEQNKGATWMQADYSYDYNFIKYFTYPEISKIPDSVKQAVDWAEEQLKNRKELLNATYPWRK